MSTGSWSATSWWITSSTVVTISRAAVSVSVIADLGVLVQERPQVADQVRLEPLDLLEDVGRLRGLLQQHPQQLGLVEVALDRPADEEAEDLLDRARQLLRAGAARRSPRRRRGGGRSSSARIASLFGKYWYSEPMEIPARSAMRLVVPAA